MRISRPLQILMLVIGLHLAASWAQAEESCRNLFDPVVSSRFQKFFQNPDLNDPIFLRPNVKKMMSEIFDQLKYPKNLNGLSLEPEYGQFGISMVGGFIIRDNEIQIRIPILILKERPLIFQRRRYRELSNGERPEQFSPLLPEFAFAVLGAVQLYAAENPQLKKLVIFANELESPSLRVSLARIGFHDLNSNSQTMILTQNLNP